MRRTLGLVLLLPWVGASAYAEETPTKRAKALFERGVEASKDDRWDDALDLFQQSDAIIRRPSTTFNIGTTLHHLGRFDEAIEALEVYLRISNPVADIELRQEAIRKIQDAHEQIDQGRSKPELASTPPDPPSEPAPLIAPPKAPATVPASEPPFYASPVVWIIAGVVIIGGAIALGAALNAHERDPYPGTAGVVLKGLRE
jgi:tetratricopeptide (TPR) repeat protein